VRCCHTQHRTLCTNKLTLHSFAFSTPVLRNLCAARHVFREIPKTENDFVKPRVYDYSKQDVLLVPFQSLAWMLRVKKISLQSVPLPIKYLELLLLTNAVGIAVVLPGLMWGTLSNGQEVTECRNSQLKVVRLLSTRFATLETTISFLCMLIVGSTYSCAILVCTNLCIFN